MKQDRETWVLCCTACVKELGLQSCKEEDAMALPQCSFGKGEQQRPEIAVQDSSTPYKDKQTMSLVR